MQCHSGYFSQKNIVLHGSLMSQNTIMVYKPNKKDKGKYDQALKLDSAKIGNIKFELFNKSELYLEPLDEINATGVKKSSKERISYTLHNPNTEDVLIGKPPIFFRKLILTPLVNTKNCKTNPIKGFWIWSQRFPDAKSWPITTLCFLKEEVSSKTKKIKESLDLIIGLCCFEGVDYFLELKNQKNSSSSSRNRSSSPLKKNKNSSPSPYEGNKFCLTRVQISSGMVSWYNCHDFIPDLTLVSCIKPSFKKDTLLLATLHENSKTKNKEPLIRLNCIQITET